MAYAVVSSNFCLPQQVTLVMQESLGAYRNDDFHICDASDETRSEATQHIFT
jgi:hypothetical protein